MSALGFWEYYDHSLAMYEAKRIARNTITRTMREQGLKLSQYPARSISELVECYLLCNEGRDVIAEAIARIKDRSVKHYRL